MDLDAARFYAILDTGYVPHGKWVSVCRALITGGADIIQLRAKRETASERKNLLMEILPLFRAGQGAPPLVINDDIGLAMQFPGLGLHIGQNDTPALEARRILGPDRILGLSTHSTEQASAAVHLSPGVLSYFAIGPVFPTQTKPDYKPVGLELVRYASGLSATIPFFSIGGINRQNAREVVACGGRRVVAVSDVLLAADPAAAIREFKTLLS